MVGSGNMWPCDFKMGKLLASLQTYRCMYNFEIRLPIFHAGGSVASTFKSVLCSGIIHHAKELQNAQALVDGKLVTEDQHISSEGIHKVELHLPFMKDSSAEACSSNDVAGLVVLTGSICASAYLVPKEPVSQAISDLKGDIISSLQSRLDIISDEAEDKVALTSNNGEELTCDILAEKAIHQLNLQEVRNAYYLSFPRRVFVPWLAGIFTFEDLKDRCKEMTSMESPVESSAILELETEATFITAKSFWDAIRGDSTHPSADSKNTKFYQRRQQWKIKHHQFQYCNFSSHSPSSTPLGMGIYSSLICEASSLNISPGFPTSLYTSVTVNHFDP